MQFIENTSSRSFLIEYSRRFFIDMSIFGHQGGPPFEGEGKAASSLPARHGGQALGRPPHAKRKAPRSQIEHGAPGKERLAAPRRGRSKQRPYEGKPHAQKNEHGAPRKANALYLRHAAMAPPKRSALARAIRE